MKMQSYVEALAEPTWSVAGDSMQTTFCECTKKIYARIEPRIVWRGLFFTWN
jgi:hypothetical protein